MTEFFHAGNGVIAQLRSGEYFLIYLRKSRQDSEFESVEEVLARHERQLQEFAVRLTGQKIEEEFIFREIVSGETISDRPEMQKIMKHIQDPKCKGVIVIDPQRLSRGDLTDLGAVIASFRYSNTLILTPSRTYNLENDYDREAFERELLRGKDYVEYTKKILMRGRQASAREGNWISSFAPYGYDRVKIGKAWTLAVNEEEAEMVQNVFDWYVNEGVGALTISHRLNELGAKPRKAERFTPTAIRQILENEVYIGKIRWNAKPVVRVFEDGKVIKKRVRNKDYEVIDGKHAPIISTEIFQRAQERRGQNTKENGNSELKNVYAGLLKCKKCGSAMSYQSYASSRRNDINPRRDRIRCRNGRRYCENKSMVYEVLDEAIIRALKAHLKDFEIEINTDNQKEIKAHEKLVKRLEKELEKIEERQESLYEYLEKKIYTPEVFKMRNEALAKERDEVSAKLKDARLYQPSVERQQQRYYSLFEAIQAIENPMISAKNKNALLKNIVEVIWYEKDQCDSPVRANIENSVFSIEIVLK